MSKIREKLDRESIVKLRQLVRAHEDAQSQLRKAQGDLQTAERDLKDRERAIVEYLIEDHARVRFIEPYLLPNIETILKVVYATDPVPGTEPKGC